MGGTVTSPTREEHAMECGVTHARKLPMQLVSGRLGLYIHGAIDCDSTATRCQGCHAIFHYASGHDRHPHRHLIPRRYRRRANHKGWIIHDASLQTLRGLGARTTRVREAAVLSRSPTEIGDVR